MSVDESLRAEQYRDASNLNARIALHELFSTNPHALPLWIFDQLEPPDDASILEIGCGTGNLWAENTKRIPEGWQITLTDASPGMICEAQQRLSGSHSFRFQVANAQELPFADESFDAVIAAHMLYHVPDRDNAFSDTKTWWAPVRCDQRHQTHVRDGSNAPDAGPRVAAREH